VPVSRPVKRPAEPLNLKGGDIHLSRAKTKKVEKIFEFWKWCMEHPGAILVPSRRRVVGVLLSQGYTAEDIIQAICGCSGSAWHMGDNPSVKKFDSLSLICRNGEKLEWFMDMTTKEAASATYRRFEKETGAEEADPGKVVQFRGGGKAENGGD